MSVCETFRTLIPLTQRCVISNYVDVTQYICSHIEESDSRIAKLRLYICRRALKKNDQQNSHLLIGFITDICFKKSQSIFKNEYLRYASPEWHFSICTIVMMCDKVYVSHLTIWGHFDMRSSGTANNKNCNSHFDRYNFSWQSKFQVLMRNALMLSYDCIRLHLIVLHFNFHHTYL